MSPEIMMFCLAVAGAVACYLSDSPWLMAFNIICAAFWAAEDIVARRWWGDLDG